MQSTTLPSTTVIKLANLLLVEADRLTVAAKLDVHACSVGIHAGWSKATPLHFRQLALTVQADPNTKQFLLIKMIHPAWSKAIRDAFLAALDERAAPYRATEAAS